MTDSDRSGCVLNLRDEPAQSRFEHYHEIADAYGLLAMQVRHIERAWCKVDTMDRIGLDEPGRDSGQLESGVLLIRNSSTTRDLIAEWLDVCREGEYRYLDDSPSARGEPTEFRAHRHDQAILSCMCKVAGVEPIPEETYFAPDWLNGGRNYPIWAARHRWGAQFRPGARWTAGHRLEVLRHKAERVRTSRF